MELEALQLKFMCTIKLSSYFSNVSYFFLKSFLKIINRLYLQKGCKHLERGNLHFQSMKMLSFHGKNSRFLLWWHPRFLPIFVVVVGAEIILNWVNLFVLFKHCLCIPV